MIYVIFFLGFSFPNIVLEGYYHLFSSTIVK